MKFDPKQLSLYAITDRRGEAPSVFLAKLEQVLKSGVSCLQLREKDLPAEDFLALARATAALCHRYQIPLIINDNVEVARRSGADGVHVGQEDCPADEIRRLTGPDFIIGCTAKTVEQALAARAAGADYLGVGAVFPSPTKSSAIRISREELRRIAEAARLPVVAIGGINETNVRSLAGSGISGIAVVSAIFSAADPPAAAARLRKLSEQVFSS